MRTLLVLFVLSTGLTFFAMGRTKARTKERTGLQRKVAHLFDRLAFGARPEEEEKLLLTGEKSVDRWISQQLDPQSIPDEAVEKKVLALKAPQMTSQELLAHFEKPIDVAKRKGIDKERFQNEEGMKQMIRSEIGKENLPDEIDREMKGQKLIRAVESRRQLQEVLVDFWYNHFNIDITKGEEKWMVPVYEKEVIRKHLFGKFGDFLRATAHSPAMLFYLDNHLSQSAIDYDPSGNPKENKKGNHQGGLNENYAREIIELHTLGVDGGYTQSDVTELARILTGWSIEDKKTDPTFKFRERVHDRGVKKFLGQTYPAGHGQEEGERALDQLIAHPSTAKFIATKLCRYFVNDDPPQALVAKVAKRFTATNGDLKETYLAIFKGAEFWSPKNYREKIKKPFHFVASSIRALGGEIGGNSHLSKILSGMGEEPYHCPPPTGYKEVASAWVNPGALVSRLQFALNLAANKIDGVYVRLPSFGKSNDSPKKLVDALTSHLLHDSLSPTSERVILSEFDSENQTMGDGEIRPISLAKAVGMTLGSPEFQRR